MSGRLVHRSTDRLPESAQRVLTEGIEACLPARAIVENLAALGFTVPERTVGRRALERRAERNRRQAVEELSRLGLSAYTPEQVFAILDRVDLKSGWYQRGARELSNLIQTYVADASPKRLRELVVVLAAFGLSSKLQQTSLSPMERARSSPESPITAAKRGIVA